jgi:hypothetical protein
MHAELSTKRGTPLVIVAEAPQTANRIRTGADKVALTKTSGTEMGRARGGPQVRNSSPGASRHDCSGLDKTHLDAR